MKRNLDVRNSAKQSGVYLYEIAEKLGVSEPTFIRMMRKELAPNVKMNVFGCIEQIKHEHELEQNNIGVAD